MLVGHSYGGSVITNAAAGNPNIKALVYVDAAAPDVGETNGSLSGSDSVLKQKPESELFEKLPYPGAPAGAMDLYLKKDIFLAQLRQRSAHRHRHPSVGHPADGVDKCLRNTVEIRRLEDDPVVVLHQQRRPDHHAHLGDGHGGTGALAGDHFDGGSHLTLISHPDAVTAVIQSGDRLRALTSRTRRP